MKRTLPQHLAIIMDGNGRWSGRCGVHRIQGYRQGVLTAEMVVSACRTHGIQYLTLYAFSTENWHRPKGEIDELLSLFQEYFQGKLAELTHDKIRIVFIGDRSTLPLTMQNLMSELEYRSSKQPYELTVMIAISYGGRQEILEAVYKTVLRHYGQEEQPTLTECSDTFRTAINPLAIPEPDLVIRTGGAQRISNFLLWHIPYAELYFTSTLWPDFSADDLEKALEDFSARTRTYGA